MTVFLIFEGRDYISTCSLSTQDAEREGEKEEIQERGRVRGE